MFRRRLLMQQAMSVPDPLAKYDPTGHTNEDMAEYPVLTDLTGNGHDITCHNFAWSGMSGIGGYAEDYTKDRWAISDSRGTVEATSNNIKVTSIIEVSLLIYYNGSSNEPSFTVPSYKIKVSGLTDGQELRYLNNANGGVEIMFTIAEDGEYQLPSYDFPGGATAYGFSFKNVQQECNITIEQLPLYGNALVSDGVDDYGICENFPILTKEKGYTVVVVRKIITNKGYVCSTARSIENGAFIFEGIGVNDTYSFGKVNYITFKPSLFTYQTSKSYNGKQITPGEAESTNRLLIFGGLLNNLSNIALYSLEIYDRDLTPYQIEAVKKRLMDKYNNPEDTTSDWYGVEWYTNQSPSRVMRIGNMNLHRTLPIQSGMYRCILNDDGEEVYKLGADDSTKKEDGVTSAVLDGTDGMVMVRIPTFYAKFVRDGNKRRVLISENNLPGFMRMGGCYISAYEATIDRTTSGTPKLASVVNETANFRGGNNNAEWDGSYRSLLGMPATVTSLTNFRTYARNRKADNTEWNCMDYHAYKALYWLYVVEYANRNCQLDFNDALTSEGFRQGGLGAGVTNINGTKWNTFNGYYPFIKCGYTNSLGNKTGIVAYTMPDEYDAEAPLTTYVPSYRGVENPFGHIWKWTDGLHIKIQSEESGGRSILYTADAPASYQDSNYDGYDEVGDIARTEGYVKDILFDDGEMLSTVTTGSSSTKDFSDYFYTNIPASGESLRGVLFGGSATDGTNAGFTYSRTDSVPAETSAHFGSRLCYIPNN